MTTAVATTLIVDKLVPDRGFGLGHSVDSAPGSIFFHVTGERDGNEDVFSTLEEGDKITGELAQGPRGPRLHHWTLAEVSG